MIRQAAISGGATRLGAITAYIPKPLLLVGEIPFLDVLVFELARHGVRNIASRRLPCKPDGQICTLKARFGLEIAVSIEPKLAGTGGALWRARDLLDDCFFLLNGDSWFDVNLLALAGPIAEDAATAGIIALRRVADAARFGVVQISGER